MEACEFIIQFSALDSSSEDLRYPIRKASKDPERNVWHRRDINLAKLRKYMQRVSSLVVLPLNQATWVDCWARNWTGLRYASA